MDNIGTNISDVYTGVKLGLKDARDRGRDYRLAQEAGNSSTQNSETQTQMAKEAEETPTLNVGNSVGEMIKNIPGKQRQDLYEQYFGNSDEFYKTGLTAKGNKILFEKLNK